MFSRRSLASDVAAGLTVACVAVPLSLAIALASGVPAAVGLVTAIVAGVVCALFGGTPLQVSGPAAAMAVLVASIVQSYGFGAILVVGIGCGVLQLLAGTLGLGRFIRLVPLPVIEGFTAGIGVIILIGQLPRALGLPAPPQSHVFEVIAHLGDYLGQTKPAAVTIAGATLALYYALRKISRRIPAHLVAVVVTTAAVAIFGVETETIGTIPRSLPAPRLPELSGEWSLVALAGSTIVVFALASLETLLSSTVVDRITRSRSDPDQELIGQGLGNVASALFGGIPVTGVIARSGMNVQAGARTRLSSIVHSLTLLAMIFALAGLIERIPVAALAAVLFSVAFNMLQPAAIVRLWRYSRSDAVVLTITFATIVFVDLLEGIQWGIVAALTIAAIRLGRPRLTVRGARLGKNYVFVLEGPLTFLSSLDMDSMREELGSLDPGRAVVFDVRGIQTIDASGTEHLAGLVQHARSCGLEPIVVGVPPTARDQLAHAVGDAAPECIVEDERCLAERLGPTPTSADTRLRAGIERFRATVRPRYAALFERLAGGQSPHTLFIACSDSRVDPNLITAADPGELFVVRDIGNLVPPATAGQASAVGAAIEFAVGVLGVSKIVVCGHSGCGAIKVLRETERVPPVLSTLDAWLDATQVRPLLEHLPRSLDADEVARLNVLRQAEHVRTYPVVASMLEAGRLSIAAWFFDVARGEIEEWTDAAKRFVPVGEGPEALERVTH